MVRTTASGHSAAFLYYSHRPLEEPAAHRLPIALPMGDRDYDVEVRFQDEPRADVR
jgi:hypothetical protein